VPTKAARTGHLLHHLLSSCAYRVTGSEGNQIAAAERPTVVLSFTPARRLRRGYGGEVILLVSRRWLDGHGSPPGL
jgi:hypothetical protein